MGGAAGITMLLGMVRIKFAAVLIGTTGVGLNASFTAIQTLIGTLAGLGLQSSAVRDIAAAVSKDDQQEIGRKVLTLRRICWLTGLIGMVTMMLLSPMISQITFGHQNHALDIAALGLVILFANLSGGQIALIQGMRRIGDIARVNIFAAILGTVAAISFYATLGLKGIVPALVTTTAAQLLLSWFFARQVQVPAANLTWRQTFAEASGMTRLGIVLMWNGLMGSGVAYLTIMFITEHEGTQAVGLYSAAFALSGIFVNFVLSAMSADYYPRLTGVASDKPSMVRMVNEQTEIGLLLALPGLLATMVFAPWLLKIFYTSEFVGAVELLQWFILGCLGRVISWPMGYIMLALGKSSWLVVSESVIHAIHVVFIYIGVQIFGLAGVAQAFFLLYVLHIPVTFFIGHKLIYFSWSKSTLATIMISIFVSALVLLVCLQLERMVATLVGAAITILTLFVSVTMILKTTQISRRFDFLVKVKGIIERKNKC